MSRSRSIAKAFGKLGVLAKASTGQSVGGVAPVANEAALGTGDVGEMKFTTATKSAFLYDGTEWDRIQTGNNAAPFFKVAPTDVSLGDQESATLSVLAGDPEGFPITYSWDALKVDSSQTVHYKEGGGTYPPGIKNIIHSPASSGTFRFQADSSGSGNKGDYTYRILANDGAISSVATAGLSIGYTNEFHTKYKAAIEAAGGTCVIHNLNPSDHPNLEDYIQSDVGSIASGRYDVLLLAPGSYTLTGQQETYGWDIWWDKAFAIVGNTARPHEVYITLDGSSGRDWAIWQGADPETGFKAAKAIANCTVKRNSSSSNNYSAAIRRSIGGMARNVLFDFNNQPVAMNYDNDNFTTKNVTMFAVTLANISSRLSSYTGQNVSMYVGRGLAVGNSVWSAYTWGNNSHAPGNTSVLQADGTKHWTYTDNGATYGHLYKVQDTNYTIDVTGTNRSMSDAETG